MRTHLILVVLFAFLSFEGLSQTNALFENATTAYNQGEYQKAIEFYEAILEKGEHSAELYFNLGNSYYKLNEIGFSIYFYEKALLLAPHDQEIKNNLNYAMHMRLDAIDEMPKTVMDKVRNAVMSALTIDQWAYLSIVLLFLFVIFFIVYSISNAVSSKRIAFIIANTALLLSVLSVVMGYWADHYENSQRPAIIFDREVLVTSEPNERSEKVFTLHEGTKVYILESLEDWNKIKIADGQTGWTPAESMKLIKEF